MYAERLPQTTSPARRVPAATRARMRVTRDAAKARSTASDDTSSSPRTTNAPFSAM
jgi:hypothetical protein